MTSSYHGGFVCLFLFLFFSSSFFSLHVRAFCLEKSGAIHFHKFIVFPLSQLRKVQFIYIYFFNLYFCWSYSTAPTAHRRQGGWGRGRGGGVQKGGGWGSLILCQRKRKREQFRRKKEIKKSTEEKKEEGEKRQQYQQFHLEFSWFHHKLSIDCFRQLQLNIKPLLSKRRED